MDKFIINLLPRGSTYNIRGIPLPLYDVIGGTCSCLDHILLPGIQYPAKGQKAFLQGYKTIGGGVSANALVFLSRMGMETAFFGLAGKDAAGDYLTKEMNDLGIDTSGYMQKKDYKTPQSFIVIDPQTGERTIMAFQPPFPMKYWDLEEFQNLCTPSPACFLFDTHHIPLKLKMAQWGKDKGIPMVWDIGTYKKGLEELFPYMDYFIAPDDFLEGYFGVPGISGEKDIGHYIQSISREGQFILTVITAGDDGAYALLNDEVVHFPALKVPQIKDTTGAGDIFHAGFVYGLIQGWDIEHTLQWATVCAGLSCGYIGGRPVHMKLEMIEREYDKYTKNLQWRRVKL